MANFWHGNFRPPKFIFFRFWVMKKILIVEDDDDMLELLSIVFRDSGYDVTFSGRSLEIGTIIALQPDLIILDVRLKGSPVSGSDLCREVKSNPQTKVIPVILASGEYNLAKIAKECNADTFLAKPYDMLGLLLTVDKYLF